jgi:hypothetical protein
VAKILETSAWGLPGSHQGRCGVGFQLPILLTPGHASPSAGYWWSNLTEKEFDMIFPFVRIHDGEILDRSSWVLEDGAGWEGEIYCRIEDAIKGVQAPKIKFEYGKIAPGFFAWLFGHRRHCLRVMNVLDGDLQTIVVCISVNSYGSALVVNWWLLTKLGFWRWLLERAGYWLDNKKPPVPLTVELDVVQKDILMKGFVTVVVTALQRAVEAVMQELGQDKGTVDSKSGFVI